MSDLTFQIDYEYISDAADACRDAVCDEGTELSRYVMCMADAAEAMDGYFDEKDVRRLMDLAIDSSMHYLVGLINNEWGWFEDYDLISSDTFEFFGFKKMTEKEWHEHNGIEYAELTILDKIKNKISKEEMDELRKCLKRELLYEDDDHFGQGCCD